MDNYLPFLTDIIDSLKGKAILLLKKANHFDKTNYQPVNVLSHICKVFGRITYNQINEYVKPLLSRILTGFRKNHITQYSLLEILEKIRKALDESSSVSAIYMDLSKAPDSLNHDLLITKL